jgi:hypothetical protein
LFRRYEGSQQRWQRFAMAKELELKGCDDSVYVDVDDAQQCTNFGFQNDDGNGGSYDAAVAVENGVSERKVSPSV